MGTAASHLLPGTSRLICPSSVMWLEKQTAKKSCNCLMGEDGGQTTEVKASMTHLRSAGLEKSNRVGEGVLGDP